ncbi:hypothetical protein E5554_05525 [Sphingobium sp. PAMC28499]|nr:hypothetical protein E5554_05525 [Sphingobium sp. PAMC28499]
MIKRAGRRFDGPYLSSDQIERQGHILELAIARLGSQGAIAFLNGEEPGLGGRPLDIAVKSSSGLEAVKRILEELRKILSDLSLMFLRLSIRASLPDGQGLGHEQRKVALMNMRNPDHKPTSLGCSPAPSSPLSRRWV